MTRTSEFLLSLALLGWSTSGMTATYRVGTGLGCTHDNLQAALDAAASNASGSFHSILVQAGELPVANLAITNPVADLAIMGGYSSCLGMRSGETVLRRNPAVSNARILSITNAPTDSNMRRTIHLDNLTLTGGHVPELTGGSGLRVVGKVSVQFGERIRIVDNDARVGGGIMVVGGDAGNANKPRLFFDAAYTATTRPVITNNRADLDGGGIFVAGAADIHITTIEISGNVAGRDGGGIAALGNGDTEIRFLDNPALFSRITNNVAGDGGFSTTSGRGGGLYLSATRVTSGSVDQRIPRLAISNNRANLGGGLYAEGPQNARPLVFLDSTTINSNTALDRGGGIYLNDT